jgi:hypothetical protein
MATNSIQVPRGLPIVSLGFIKVANNGTVVPFSVNIDASNNNAPGTVFAPTNTANQQTYSEYTPTFRGFKVWAYKPGANNSGAVPNSNNIYVMMAPAGGNGNKQDFGSMLAVIGPGNNWEFPVDGAGRMAASPYYYYLDADTNGDGAIIVAYGTGS